MSIPIAQQNIIGILGIESLSDEEKVAIVDKITVLVEKRLLLRIFESLDALRQTEFSELLEKEDQKALQEFLERQVPNMNELLETEVAAVKQELNDWAESLG